MKVNPPTQIDTKQGKTDISLIHRACIIPTVHCTLFNRKRNEHETTARQDDFGLYRRRRSLDRCVCSTAGA
jgi:hypothetical protein